MKRKNKFLSAAVYFSEEITAVLCRKENLSVHFFSFDDYEQFKKAVEKKEIEAEKWTLVIDKDRFVTKSVSLPAADVHEAYMMLEFKLPDIVPLEVSDVIYSCRVVDRRGEKVCLKTAIIKKDIFYGELEKYQFAGFKFKDAVAESLLSEDGDGSKGSGLKCENMEVNKLTPAAQKGFAVTSAALRENSQNRYARLIPIEIVRKKERRKKIVGASVIAGKIVLCLILLKINLWAVNFRIEKKCDKFNKLIRPIENVAGSIENKKLRLQALQQQLSDRDIFLRILSELYEFSPKDISISDLRFRRDNEKNSVQMRGEATSLSAAFNYPDKMSDAEILNGLQIITAQQTPRPGGSIVEFSAECQF